MSTTRRPGLGRRPGAPRPSADASRNSRTSPAVADPLLHAYLSSEGAPTSGGNGSRKSAAERLAEKEEQEFQEMMKQAQNRLGAPRRSKGRVSPFAGAPAQAQTQAQAYAAAVVEEPSRPAGRSVQPGSMGGAALRPSGGAAAAAMTREERRAERHRKREEKARRELEREEAERRQAAALEGERQQLLQAEQRRIQQHEEQQRAAMATKRSAAESKKEKDEDEDEDGDDYEDDFEDYEDDFEDEEQEEDEREQEEDVTAKIPAFRQELQELQRKRQQGEQESLQSQKPLVDHAASAPKPRIYDPQQALQRQQQVQLASMLRGRAAKLLETVQLGVTAMVLFEIEPASSYELYKRKFGQQAVKEASSQCPVLEEREEVEVQTEDPEVQHVGAQVPEDMGASGEESKDSSSSADATEKVDMIQLAKFLSRAGRLCEALMDSSATKAPEVDTSGLKTTFSRPASNFVVSFLKGRSVVDLAYLPDASHKVAVAYAPMEEATPADRIYKKGLCCVWQVRQRDPISILVCEAGLTCCCTIPRKPFLVVAGSQDGSLFLWDLREPIDKHVRMDIRGRMRHVQYPTYSTDWLASDNHQDQVVKVLPVGHHAKRPAQSTSAFQIASVDASGVVIFWTIAEMQTPETGGSLLDLGLNVGSKVKLVQNNRLKLECPDAPHAVDYRSKEELELMESMGGFQAFDAACKPDDPASLVVATDVGMILQASRFGGSSTASSSSSLSHPPHQTSASSLSTSCGFFSGRGLLPAAMLPSEDALHRDLNFLLDFLKRETAAAKENIAPVRAEVSRLGRYMELEFLTGRGAQVAREVLSSATSGEYAFLLGKGKNSPVLLVTPVIGVADSGSLFDSSKENSHVGGNESSWVRAKTEAMVHAFSIPLTITSLDFSPFVPRYFVAGFDDGSVGLFDYLLKQPLYLWDDISRGAVRRVAWSNDRPTVFFVLHADERFSIFDLTQQLEQPSEVVTFRGSGLCDFCLSPASSAASSYAAFAFQDGHTETHSLIPELSSLRDQEEEEYLVFRLGGIR